MGDELHDSITKSSVVIELDTSFNCIWNKTLPVDHLLTGPGPFFQNAYIDSSNNIYTSGFTDLSTPFDTDTLTTISLTNFVAKLNYSSTITAKENYLDNSKFMIFPNPSSNNITINYSNKNQTGSVSLYVRNMIGQNIYTETSLYENEYKKTVDLSKQAKGIYFVELQLLSDNSKTHTREIRKIVLQ